MKEEREGRCDPLAAIWYCYFISWLHPQWWTSYVRFILISSVALQFFVVVFFLVQNDTILHLATFSKAYEKGQTLPTLKLCWVFRSYLPGWKKTKKNWMLQHKFPPFVLCLDQRLHASYFTFFCFCEYQNDDGAERSWAAVWIIILFVCPPACCRRSLRRWLKRRVKNPGMKAMTSLFCIAQLCTPICACILMSEKKKICTLEALK